MKEEYQTIRDKRFIWYSLFLIFWLFTMAWTVVAQQVVTGRIIDATDGEPIPYASIFIANTTVGIVSDESGNYSVTVPGTGSFEIGVSHVGYQPVFHKVEIPKSFHQIHFVLEIREIPEVVITAPNNYRESDVRLFWRMLLGERPTKNGMEVLNPEKIYLYRNSDNVLHVSCNEPIEIVNHEMGYRIWYMLKNFQYNYRQDYATFSGVPVFEELTPQNNRQKVGWERKRREVYAVSVTRFMRALYRKELYENGFLLVEKDAARQTKTPFPLNDILQANQVYMDVNIETPLFLGCLSMPITGEMIRNTWDTLFDNRAKFPITVLLPQQITVFSDGTYTGILETQEYRNSLFGRLCAILPAEYDDK